LDLLSQSSLDFLVKVVLLTEFTGELVRFVFFAPKNDNAFSGLIVAEVYSDPNNFVRGLVCQLVDIFGSIRDLLTLNWLLL